MKIELNLPTRAAWLAMAGMLTSAALAQDTPPAPATPPAATDAAKPPGTKPGAEPAAAEQEEESDINADGDFKPKSYDEDRYAKMLEKSPFEFELKAEAPPPAPDPFEGITLAGYAGAGNNMTVYLQDAKTNSRLTVYGDASPRKKKDETGFTVVRLNRTKNRMTTTVTLIKDGKEKEIGFDRKALGTMKATGGGGAAGASTLPPGTRPGVPGLPNVGGLTRASGGTPGGGYQAPQAVIPGQAPAPAAGAGAQPAPVNLGMPANPNAAAVNNMTGTAQPNVQVNPIQPGQQVQPAQPGQPAPGAAPAAEQPRRRVVLPTPAP